jgi:hypothetical protein
MALRDFLSVSPLVLRSAKRVSKDEVTLNRASSFETAAARPPQDEE